MRQIDLISSVESLASGSLRIYDVLALPALEAGEGAYIASDTWLISSSFDLIFQFVEKVGEVLIATISVLLRSLIVARPQPHQRNIVLPVVARRSEVANNALNVANLLQQLIIDRSIDSRSIIQCQGRIKGKALEVGDWVDIHSAILRVIENLFDRDVAFEVKNWHV